ncbi:hypothetical protein NL489_27865, partial [Klebsiella pneumoniae]|nr:hypothetical protein [Klebsiella pneumoniae]
LRSGYLLPDTKAYGDRIERMLRLSLNIDPEAQVEEEPEESLKTPQKTQKTQSRMREKRWMQGQKKKRRKQKRNLQRRMNCKLYSRYESR